MNKGFQTFIAGTIYTVAAQTAVIKRRKRNEMNTDCPCILLRGSFQLAAQGGRAPTEVCRLPEMRKQRLKFGESKEYHQIFLKGSL